MDETQTKSPLRRLEWMAELLECSRWAVLHKIREKQIPAWCVIRIGNQLRVIERQARHWLNGGKEPLSLPSESQAEAR